MDNSLPDPETLQLLREHVARYTSLELPQPDDVGHCDDCGTWEARWRLGRLDLCWRCFLRRRAVSEALTAS